MIRSERPKRVRGSNRLCQRVSCTAWRASASRPALSPAAAPGASIGFEDIADAPHRLQIAREFGIALDLAAEPRHLHVDGADVAAELCLFGEPLTADGRAGPLGEHAEERRFGGGQVHGLVAAQELTALEV